jgi:hypothetical protein
MRPQQVTTQVTVLRPETEIRTTNVERRVGTRTVAARGAAADVTTTGSVAGSNWGFWNTGMNSDTGADMQSMEEPMEQPRERRRNRASR